MTSDRASFEERLARNMGAQDALNDLCDFLEHELGKLDPKGGPQVQRQVVLRDVVRWAEAQRAMIVTEDQSIQADHGGTSPAPPSGAPFSPGLGRG